MEDMCGKVSGCRVEPPTPHWMQVVSGYETGHVTAVNKFYSTHSTAVSARYASWLTPTSTRGTRPTTRHLQQLISTLPPSNRTMRPSNSANQPGCSRCSRHRNLRRQTQWLPAHLASASGATTLSHLRQTRIHHENRHTARYTVQTQPPRLTQPPAPPAA